MECIHQPQLTKEEYVQDMQKIYSEDEQKKYGIVCIVYEK